jgi:hypothetical protein
MDLFGVPVFLLLFFFWWKLTSESHSSLLLLLFWVLLLVLSHLELHHLDPPGLDVWIFPQVGVLAVDLAWLWPPDLVDKTVVATEEH